MKDESDTPFSFNPGDNNMGEEQKQSSSFFENNKKLIIIIVGVVLLLVIVALVLIIVLTKGKENVPASDQVPSPDLHPLPSDKTSDNYLIAIFEITNFKNKQKIYNQYSLPPQTFDYTQTVMSARINNIPVNLDNGEYQFVQEGNYTVNIYFNQTLNRIDNLFFECTNLVEIDFSHFKVEEVTSMKSLFKACIKLKKITYGDNFKTNKLINIEELFSNCESLTEVDLSKFDCTHVEQMSSLFDGCTNLKNINFGNINTKRVKNMRRFFSGCTSLSSVDLSKFDTSQVTNFESMFEKSKMTTIPTKYINTNSALDLSGMFEECTELILLDLENFNTSNVNDMCEMFSGCSKLQSLKLDNFDTQNVLSMQKMFIDCQELKSIDLKSFTNPKLTNIEEMFSGCTSLSSLDMSSFNSKLITDMDNAFNGVSIEGKITYNSTIFTENLISQIPEKWEKIDIKNGN